MKTDTRVWYLFQSVGRPAETKKGCDTIRNIIMLWAQWLTDAYMGSKIRVTLARTESELHESKRSVEQGDMLSDLEALLGGTPESVGCTHGNDPQSCEECNERNLV